MVASIRFPAFLNLIKFFNVLVNLLIPGISKHPTFRVERIEEQTTKYSVICGQVSLTLLKERIEEPDSQAETHKS